LGGAQFKKVSSSKRGAIALDTQNRLWAWGNNNSSQLGDGTNISRFSPVPVPMPAPTPVMHPDIIATRELMAPDVVIVPLEITVEGDYVIRVNSGQFNAFMNLRDSNGKRISVHSQNCYESNKGIIAHMIPGTYDVLVTSDDNQSGEFSINVNTPNNADYQEFVCGAATDDHGLQWWGSDYGDGYGGDYGGDYGNYGV
jgi:hypothetical protein